VEILGDFPQEAGDAADVLGIVGHGGRVIGESLFLPQAILVFLPN
jgi:hypothetical protein